jgi:hypothetical protein
VSEGIVRAEGKEPFCGGLASRGARGVAFATRGVTELVTPGALGTRERAVELGGGTTLVSRSSLII